MKQHEEDKTLDRTYENLVESESKLLKKVETLEAKIEQLEARLELHKSQNQLNSKTINAAAIMFSHVITAE